MSWKGFFGEVFTSGIGHSAAEGVESLVKGFKLSAEEMAKHRIDLQKTRDEYQSEFLIFMRALGSTAWRNFEAWEKPIKECGEVPYRAPKRYLPWDDDMAMTAMTWIYVHNNAPEEREGRKQFFLYLFEVAYDPERVDWVVEMVTQHPLLRKAKTLAVLTGRGVTEVWEFLKKFVPPVTNTTGKKLRAAGKTFERATTKSCNDLQSRVRQLNLALDAIGIRRRR